MLRLSIIALLAAPLLLAVPGLRPDGSDIALEPVPSAPPVVVTPPADPMEALPEPVLGFALNAHHIGRLDLYLDGIDAIAEMGANTLTILTPMYQRTVRTSDIRMIPERCATDHQLVALLQRAHDRGLRTVLMPIVLLEDPGHKDWRGVIEPRSWDAWWGSYDGVIDRVLSIAERAPVDVLSIGSELNSTENQLARWRRVVQRVRSRFGGAIMYSANWDRYDRVEIWPLVDIMAVSSYFELERERHGASETELVRAWVTIRNKLLEVAKRWDRPLLLSEIGYPALPWAHAHPWNYVADKDQNADPAAQATSWRAFFSAWTDELIRAESPLLGFCGYRWDPYHRGGAKDTGYGVVGKPSHDILRAGFRTIRESVDARKSGE